ncbi:hypothetical protein BDA99DRAFT_554001 [Phascolomyces articulosus]|uniref:Uncharacterized protein n=1 Tax=Phascolomyces articulosus TaxID=60185 RepID=A0AAD5PKI8_9FUNG|nr:hypothetical protein BDA99DRAFT_554001 [Phascolomyces articulosus]
MALNRPEYRDPKTLRAVKVYTIAQESRYLIIENVPALGVVDNLLSTCQSILKRHANDNTNERIETHGVLDNHHASDEFHDVIWIAFSTATAARKIKQQLDDRPFFTNILRVSYAPEYETADDVRNKLQERRRSPLATWQPKKKKRKRQKNQSSPSMNAVSTPVVQPQPLIGPMKPSSSSSSFTTSTIKNLDGGVVAQHNDDDNKAKKKRRRI